MSKEAKSSEVVGAYFEEWNTAWDYVLDIAIDKLEDTHTKKPIKQRYAELLAEVEAAKYFIATKTGNSHRRSSLTEAVSDLYLYMRGGEPSDD